MAGPTNAMSDSDNAPVIVNRPKSKTMAAEPKVTRSRSRKPRMAESPTAPPSTTGAHMQPFRAATGDPPTPAEYPPMQPKPHRAPAATGPATSATSASATSADGDGYVRMRLVFDGDALTLVGMKAVEGPLVEHQELHGEMAYEVTVGTKRVATGPVVDLGPNRAFPPQGSAPGDPGHAFVAPSYQEVVARVPRRALTIANLARTNVSLLRIKDGPVTVPSSATAPGSLTETHEREVREVTRLAGIRLDDLPDHVRAEVNAALG